MTEAEKERLRKLESEATPGPWTADKDEVNIYGWEDDECVKVKRIVEEGYKADAQFIAAARTAVPALLDENARMREALEKIANMKPDSGLYGNSYDGLTMRDIARAALGGG